jgi:hypothetical protein
MTLSSHRLSAFLSIAATVVLLVGCGGDGKTEIQGVATWNGAPIEEGYVELSPTDGQGQVVGADVKQGAFTLRTVPGEKHVSVTAKKKIGERPPTERIPYAEPIYQQFLPAKFNENSELHVTIASDDPTLRLELTGEEAPVQSSGEQARAAAMAQRR